MNPFSNPSYLLPPLIAAGVITALLILVWQKSRKDFSRLIFSGFLLSLALWSLLTFGMRSSPDIYHALVWEKALVVAAIPSFALYYHFTLAYTNTTIKRWIIPALYSFLAASAIIVATTDLGIKGMSLEYYGYAPIMGPLLFLMYAPMPFLIAAGVYNLLKRYRASLLYEERNHLLYLAIVVIFPLLGAGLDAFSDLPPAAIWSNLIFGTICSIVILKYHLLDIRIVVRKSLVYLLISTVVGIPYAGIIVLLNQVTRVRIEAWWVHAFVILLLAVVLRPLYSWAQNLVNRLFYGDRYDYLKALERFSQETQSIVNLKELGASMVQLVSRALQASSVYLLLLSEGKHGLVVVSSSGLESPTSGVVLNNSSPLVRWLDLHEGILPAEQLSIIPQLQSLSLKEKNNFERMGAELYVPIKTRQGQLSGILILGLKLSQQPYSNEERQLLMTLSNQMAMALENARLYDSEKELREMIEAQSVQKTEFLHTVAHELKTPLSAVLSSSELLSENASISSSLRKRLVNNVRQSALSMERRVGELLDLASIQVGEMQITLEPLNLVSVINEVSSQMRILIKNKKQKLRLEVPSSLRIVNGDGDKLQQVLVNFLSNANKFSPDGSKIILRARNLNNKITIEVEDSAPELTDVEKMKIFEPYYRGNDYVKRRRFAGLGIGLSISKKLIELHKGEIWVESKPGKGNVFAFSIPISD